MSVVYAVNLKKLTDHSLPFMQGCNNQWLTALDQQVSLLPNILKNWLFDQHSLSQRLTEKCGKFSVQLLRQGPATLADNEQHIFASHLRQPAHDMTSREVLLLCDDVPQVYARTLIPQATLEIANNKLQHLGNTSLGEVLFQSSNMQRGTIEVSEFTQSSSIAQFCQQLGLTSSQNLWARRSMFRLDNQPLMVSEIFLPGAFAYNETNND